MIGALTCGAALLTGSMTAWALDTNDRLMLTLDGGEQVHGWFVRAEKDAVVIAIPGHRETTRVRNNLVAQVRLNGDTVAMDDYRSQLQVAYSEWVDWVANPPPHPPPVLVGTMGAVFPGSGHAALGEWRHFAGYAIADVTLIGLMGLELATQQRLGMLLTLGGVDLIVRGVSVGDAARISRRRRRQLREARSRL